jgi:hypothetical protein
MVPTLILLCVPPAAAQTVPAGWQTIQDSRSACQIAVPPEWAPWGNNSGAAVLGDASTAIAVVTSQPGQAFKPLPDSLQKVLGIRKEKMFENSAKRIFYQDKTSGSPQDSNAYSASVPGKSGSTCSCRVNFLPGLSEDTARKIALSLGPVEAPAGKL